VTGVLAWIFQVAAATNHDADSSSAQPLGSHDYEVVQQPTPILLRHRSLCRDLVPITTIANPTRTTGMTIERQKW